MHEINNPLQAIRGALALALDDIENPRELREYITISQQEIEHITALLGQVRLIYRSQNDQPELIPLSVLFRDAIDLTREETMRQKVKINNLLPSNSPLVEGVYNHIYIVILRTILAFTDAIGETGGGELTITAEDTPTQLQIYFTTIAPIIHSSAWSWFLSCEQDADEIRSYLFGRIGKSQWRCNGLPVVRRSSHLAD